MGQERKREEERRRKEEERREEERKRKEQNAAYAVRQVISRLKVATPETIDKCRSEMEQVMQRNVDDLGSEKERVAGEVEGALKQAVKCVEEIKAKREADEKKRIEDEK